MARVRPLSGLSSLVSDVASGVTAMRFSTDGKATWNDWSPYNPSAGVTLPGGNPRLQLEVQGREEGCLPSSCRGRSDGDGQGGHNEWLTFRAK
jgi:hypothetical protein